MTNNPYRSRSEYHPGQSQYDSLKIGESMAFTPQGKDNRQHRTYVIFKTDRGFSADLAAAYNEAMDPKAAARICWRVNHEGQIFLGDAEPKTGSPAEQWKPDEGEMEWTHRAVGEYMRRFPGMDALGKDKAHFNAQMDRWRASKPWAREAAE